MDTNTLFQETNASPQSNSKETPLKLVIVGHVDHGKSTFIGRMLYDTDSIEPEKLDKIQRICKDQHKPFEFAFLLDALEEEQLQGITIDTTQIRFKTPKRPFLIIDTPGHKEFLKNMVTGAANASLALVLIDALEGIQEQSKRHSYLLSFLGIQHIMVLVNKMDLIQYEENRFNEICEEYTNFLSTLDINVHQVVPISALNGDNIVFPSMQMPWYTGPTVLSFLETFQATEPVVQAQNFLRLPVQDVYKFDHRRIITGRIENGNLSVGDKIKVLPLGHEATIQSIEAWPDSDSNITTSATTGHTVGITLDYPLFIERGNVIVDSQYAPQPAQYLWANLFWMQKAPASMEKRYKLKLGSQEVSVFIQEIKRVLKTDTMTFVSNPRQIAQFDTAEVLLRVERPIIADNFHEISRTGRFVLVDEYNVAGGGVVLSTNPLIADEIVLETESIQLSDR